MTSLPVTESASPSLSFFPTFWVSSRAWAPAKSSSSLLWYLLHLLDWLLSHGDLVLVLLPHHKDGGHLLLSGGGGDGLLLDPDCLAGGGHLLHGGGWWCQ